jgi:hypothetical protein
MARRDWNRQTVAFCATKWELARVLHLKTYWTMNFIGAIAPSPAPHQGATLDRVYRYRLWREWNPDAPRVSFVMLNPSTADAKTDDPTIRRCLGFAQSWGYGSLEVVNLFAYRATDPQELRGAADPIGAENDRYLIAASQRAQTLILAWGNWGKLHQRDQAVLRLLAECCKVYCLGINRSGQPRHPLYVRSDAVLLPWVRSSA